MNERDVVKGVWRRTLLGKLAIHALLLVGMASSSLAKDRDLLHELEEAVFQRLDQYNEANEAEDLQTLLTYVDQESEWYRKGFQESLRKEFEFFGSIGIVTGNRTVRWTQYGLRPQPTGAVIEEDVVWWGYPSGSNVPIIHESHAIRELVAQHGGWKLSRLILESPGEEPQIAKGLSALGQDQLAEARASFEEALSINPDSARASGYLGFTYLALGQKQQAVEHLSRAVNTNSGLVPFAYVLATAYSDQGNAEGALSVLKQNVSANPLSKWPRWYLGQHHLENRRFEEASAAFESITVMFPRSPVGFYGKGLIAFEQGTSEATELFQQVIELAPLSDFAQVAKRKIELLKSTAIANDGR